jgi:hypothetical protein
VADVIKMPERRVVVDELHLDYEGIFDSKALLNMIDDFFRERGYDKRELRNVETVKPSGKNIELVIMPWKTITDYAKLEIKVRIWLRNLKQIEVKKDGAKLKLDQGTVNLIFDAYLTTDVEGRWESKPMFFFIRTFWDKFLMRSDTSKWEGLVTAHTKELHTQIKSFLNLQKF